MEGLAGNIDLRFAVENIHQGVEGRGVLAEALPGVESKEGQGAGRLIDNGPADDGARLVVHQAGHTSHFPDQTFFVHLNPLLARLRLLLRRRRGRRSLGRQSLLGLERLTDNLGDMKVSQVCRRRRQRDDGGIRAAA